MAIAAVGGGNNSSAVGVITLTVTYSPTAGNTVLLWFNVGGAVTGLTVQDNHGNLLTAGPTLGNLASFYQTNVPAVTTSYTANWTTAQQCSLVLEEYSGAPNVNAVGATNSGSSATATISLAITAANNFIVAGMGSANTLTASVGTQRQQTTAGTGRATLLDNTNATAGTSVTCTCTLTSAAWNAIALEIGGAGKPRVDQEVQLVLKKVTSNKPHVNQDLQLVIKQPTTAKPHVNQDFQLVLVRTRRGNIKQDLQLVIKQPTSSRAHVNQDLQLVVVRNTAVVVQPFVFVTC